MSDVSQVFLATSRHTFARWLERIEKSVARLTPDQIWWRGAENSNAIGNLILHLSGNVRQWIVAGVGGTTDTRNRDAEFAQRDPLPAEEILDRLRAAVRDADAALARLTPEDLLTRRQIQKWDLTVIEAIQHVTEHFALHSGQILYATKLLTGEDLGFYSFLTKRGAAPPPRTGP